jgi:hypothetical protein
MNIRLASAIVRVLSHILEVIFGFSRKDHTSVFIDSHL